MTYKPSKLGQTEVQSSISLVGLCARRNFFCKHVRLSYVISAYLLTYLEISPCGAVMIWATGIISAISRSFGRWLPVARDCGTPPFRNSTPLPQPVTMSNKLLLDHHFQWLASEWRSGFSSYLSATRASTTAVTWPCNHVTVTYVGRTSSSSSSSSTSSATTAAAAAVESDLALSGLRIAESDPPRALLRSVLNINRAQRFIET